MIIIEELINIHLNNKLYLSNVIKKEHYDVYYSNLIDDEYWNFAYLKNNNIILNEIIKNIKLDMNSINRKPIIYVTSNITNNQLQEQIKQSKIDLLYSDTWMVQNNLKEFENYKSQIDFYFKEVDEDLKEEFINAVFDGFSSDNKEEPYQSLSTGYRVALENSFTNNDKEYKIINYLGKNEKEIISTATVVYKNDKAIIYNVTTNKNYRRKGVCKKMMTNIIHELVKLNINEVCVQTEKGFYTEEVYKKMGFKEILLGKVYILKE